MVQAKCMSSFWNNKLETSHEKFTYSYLVKNGKPR
jgi:hypothetical protein